MQNAYASMPMPGAAQTNAPSALRGRLVLICLPLAILLLMGLGVYVLQTTSASGLALGYPMPDVKIDQTTLPGTVSVNQLLTFSASSPGRNLTYTWDFGDQTATATGASVTHSYANTDEGNNFQYTVTVTVVDVLGRSSTDTLSVKVLPPPPVAQFSALEEYSYYVYFDASNSTYNTQNVTYTWDFGDGSPTDSPGTNYDYHSYNGPNTYTVTLTVMDGAGQSNTVSQSVIVQ